MGNGEDVVRENLTVITEAEKQSIINTLRDELENLEKTRKDLELQIMTARLRMEDDTSLDLSESITQNETQLAYTTQRILTTEKSLAELSVIEGDIIEPYSGEDNK